MPTRDEDGSELTLGEKISEFSEDILTVSIIAPLIVVVISITINCIVKANKRK